MVRSGGSEGDRWLGLCGGLDAHRAVDVLAESTCRPPSPSCFHSSYTVSIYGYIITIYLFWCRISLRIVGIS